MTDDHTHEPEDREAAPPSPPEVAPSSRPPAVEPASPPPRNPGAARGPAALVASPARPVRLATPAHRLTCTAGACAPTGGGRRCRVRQGQRRAPPQPIHTCVGARPSPNRRRATPARVISLGGSRLLVRWPCSAPEFPPGRTWLPMMSTGKIRKRRAGELACLGRRLLMRRTTTTALLFAGLTMEARVGGVAQQLRPGVLRAGGRTIVACLARTGRVSKGSVASRIRLFVMRSRRYSPPLRRTRAATHRPRVSSSRPQARAGRPRLCRSPSGDW